VPSVRELVDRIMNEADAIISRRLAGMRAASSASAAAMTPA
jgi:hypothetical protein